MPLSPKKLAVFDLDGTLTESKSPIDGEMADLLVKLLSRMKVAIISGGGYPQFQAQLLAGLPGTTDNYTNLFLLPTSGTRLYVWQGAWVLKYAENMLPAEKEKILTAISSGLIEAGYQKPQKVYGDLIEDRGSQITFSALGQKAPVEEKYAWDPTREKRERIASFISKRLAGYDVRVGGATSVDVTKRGVNKAYGIRKLEQLLNMDGADIVFVGDALFYGGNDYPAKATGVDCVSVKGPAETKQFVRELLK
jgi:HAD superfamily hydrolase (TIGR01484 family)